VEGGFYLPFAVTRAGELLSDAAMIRSLFVVPDAAKRNFFYGVNFELGYELPPFSPTPWGLEIRPIVGVRDTNWEFIVGYGFTPGSDRLVFKAIIGYDFPVPGKSNDGSPASPQAMGTSARAAENPFVTK
jgi:hypothetical protein